MQKDRPFTTESRWCKLCVQQLRVKRGPVVEVYILLIRKLEDFQSQCTTPTALRFCASVHVSSCSHVVPSNC